MKKLFTYHLVAFLLLGFINLLSVNEALAQFPYTNGFEGGDPALTYDGPQLPFNATTNPLTGTNHGKVDGGCSGGTAGCIDGSIITGSLSFLSTRYYKVEVWSRVATCTGRLQIMKSATATNAAMLLATGGDIILSSSTNNVTSTTYAVYTAIFTVPANETMYVGFQFFGTGGGGCAGRWIAIDDITITESTTPFEETCTGNGPCSCPAICTVAMNAACYTSTLEGASACVGDDEGCMTANHATAKFYATPNCGGFLDITVNNLGVGFTGDVEVVVDPGPCPPGNPTMGTGCGPAPFNVVIGGLTNGTTYMVRVSSSDGVSGVNTDFRICITDGICSSTGNAYGVYAEDAASGVADCEISATGGAPSGDGFLVSSAGVDDAYTNVAISGYPVITASNISCTNVGIDFTTTDGTPDWNFGAGATPATGSTSPFNDVQYSSTGRKDITESTNLYTGFVNIIMAAPSSGSVLGTSSLCSLTDTGSYASSEAGAPGYTYYWTIVDPAGGTSSILNFDSSTTDIIFANTTAGGLTFPVSLEIISGCCDTLLPVIYNVYVYPDPAQPAAADTSRCVGGSQDLIVSPIVAGYNYNWFDAPLGGNQLSSGVLYTVDPVLLGATNYYVGAVNTAGCVGVRDTVVLTGTDTPPAFTGSPFTQCAPGFVTLTVDPATMGATYVWYNLVSGGTVLQSSTDSSYNLLVPTGPASQSVWVSVIDSGCGESSRTEGVATITGGVSPTTWNGDASTDWFNDANWSACVPSCFVDAIIPTAGVMSEPTISFANGLDDARVRNIEIQSGRTLTFGDSKAKLEVCGDWTQFGAISMPGIGLVAFVSTTGSQLITTAAGPFNILQINNTSSTPLVTLSGAAAANVTINATGELRLTNGVLETTIDKAVVVLNTDEDAVTGSSTASYIWGNITRYILAAGGRYDFPVGNGGSFQLFNINISASNGLGNLNVFFENTTDAIFSILPLFENGGVYDTILDNGGSIGGVWTMTPDIAATTDYDLTLYGRDYGLTFVDSAHTIVKRVDNTSAWTLLGTYDSTGTGVFGGVVTVRRTAYSGFSQVAIATSKTAIVVLPIELLYFTGYAKGTYVVLEWITVSEENNDHFNIQRSKDGKNFETIGTIPGAGTSNDIRDYLHVDDKPNKGVNYYRLKQTDFDGQESFSEIIKVNVNTGVFEIGNIYPVPAEGSVVITFNSNSEDVVNLTIFDITGKESMSDKYYAYVGFNSVSVNVSDLAKGVYFLHLEKNGERIYKKMLKD